MASKEELIDLVNNLRKKGYTQEVISEKAGYSEQTLTQVLSSGKVSDRFYNAIDKFYKSVLTESIEPKPQGIKKDTLDKDVLRMVAQSNLNQSEANRNQSIANRKLAESISTLTHQFTVGGSSEIREEMADWFEKMFQIIRKLSAGQSVDEDLGTFWTSGKLKSDSSLNSNQDA